MWSRFVRRDACTPRIPMAMRDTSAMQGARNRSITSVTETSALCRYMRPLAESCRSHVGPLRRSQVLHIANLVGYYANPSAVTCGKRTLLRANAC
jgi:hypothetical protein